MTLKNLIKYGYFTEELPPAFNTLLFGDNVRRVQSIIASLDSREKKKLNETNFVTYSIPKVGIHRRLNGIPNPYHQFLLSNAIYRNWSQIKKHYKKSSLSASIPEVDKSKKRAIVQFAKYELFKEKCIISSFDAFFELRSDILRYFPSIYTHSIPWALHTKGIAKTRRRDKTLLGNLIDEYIRYAQNGQTIGMPIGTDTSRIVSEIIGCAIDEQISKALKRENVKCKGYRFVDDCHFFFSSQADAEIALKCFQKILADFSLNINEEKTSISKAPFLFENNWNHQLVNFKIRKDKRFQRLDLRNYFNILINFSKQYPNDFVIKYGIKTLRKVKIFRNNWNLFESLVYSLAIAEGAILPDLLAILLQNQKIVNRKMLESTISALLNQHVYRANHFEVSWTLWIAKSFDIRLKKEVAQAILESRDIVSILILLDLQRMKLVTSRLRLSDLRLEFNQYGLTNEYWLLVYEASHKNWISTNALATVEFFKKLSANAISFYDSSRQIEFGDSNIVGKQADSEVDLVSKKIEEKHTSKY
ncbi:MAG: RNA-directed DNA polymerase [Chitinophagaceae bacterium]|nr:RNA-directed DNA polymerase [Chitinophagaceae bacterium]